MSPGRVSQGGSRDPPMSALRLRPPVSSNKSFDTDVLAAGVARLWPAVNSDVRPHANCL